MSPARSDVLFVNHAAELGGGELALFDHVARQAGRAPGLRVLLLSDGPLHARLTAAGVAVELLDAGSVLDIRRGDGARALQRAPRLLRLVLALARRFRAARLVYANSQKAFVAAALATVVQPRPLIWHLHDILDPQHFSGLMRRIAIDLGNRCASLVVANSLATRDAYRAAGGRVAVAVVYNGIDPLPYETADRTASRIALAEAIGSGDAPLLGVFGRLAAWKGQHVAVRALTFLPECHLVLVGGALFGEEPYAAELRALAGRMGVIDRVHFLGFRSDMASLMTGVDIALHCSTAPEPFGRVIVEAMMARTPVIATAAGGALEIVEHGCSGILVPPDDDAALASAIRDLLDDPVSAARLAVAGHIRARALFSLDAATERLAAIVDTVAAGLPVLGTSD